MNIPQKNTCKLSVKEGTSLALRKKEHKPFKVARGILKNAIKKAVQCNECGAILADNLYPVTCDDCQKAKYLNRTTLRIWVNVFRDFASLDINDIYDVDWTDRFNLKEIIRGLTKQKPVLPFRFENVIKAHKDDVTQDHINGCTTIANQVVVKIKNYELVTDQAIKQFIWEKSGKVVTTKKQNTQGLKEMQNENNDSFITPEQYISVVGRIQKQDGTFYTNKESANMIRPYFLNGEGQERKEFTTANELLAEAARINNVKMARFLLDNKQTEVSEDHVVIADENKSYEILSLFAEYNLGVVERIVM